MLWKFSTLFSFLSCSSSSGILVGTVRKILEEWLFYSLGVSNLVFGLGFFTPLEFAIVVVLLTAPLILKAPIDVNFFLRAEVYSKFLVYFLFAVGLLSMSESKC